MLLLLHSGHQGSLYELIQSTFDIEDIFYPQKISKSMIQLGSQKDLSDILKKTFCKPTYPKRLPLGVRSVRNGCKCTFQTNQIPNKEYRVLRCSLPLLLALSSGYQNFNDEKNHDPTLIVDFEMNIIYIPKIKLLFTWPVRMDTSPVPLD